MEVFPLRSRIKQGWPPSPLPFVCRTRQGASRREIIFVWRRHDLIMEEFLKIVAKTAGIRTGFSTYIIIVSICYQWNRWKSNQPILIASPKMKIRINLSRLAKVYSIKCWGIGNDANKRKYNPSLKNLKNIVEISLQLKMIYTSNAMPIWFPRWHFSQNKKNSHESTKIPN